MSSPGHDILPWFLILIYTELNIYRLKYFPMACRLFELYGRETNMKLLAKELAPLQGIGPQKCISFSVDGSKFAAGGMVSINLESNQSLLFSSQHFEFFLFKFDLVCLTSVFDKCRMDISESWSGLVCV